MTNRRIAVVPARDGQLAPGGVEAVAEAGGIALVIGSGVELAAAELVGIATRATLIEAGDFAPAAWAQAVSPLLAEQHDVILPASPDGRDLAPRLAARLDRPLLAGALSVGGDSVCLVRHGGLVQVDITVSEPFVATLQPGVRGAQPDPALAPPTIEEIAYETIAFDPNATHPDESEPDGPPHDPLVLEVRPADAATMDLAEAQRIVGGGAGLLGADAVARFEELTRFGVSIGASMGATRVVTDAGIVSHERQIGTTGVVVDPRLYLAFAISGAVQHTAGLGHPDHVISVNTDPHCPMMAMADLAIVADADATVSALSAMRATRTGDPVHG